MSDMTMVDTDQIKNTIAKLDGIVATIRANVKTAQDALSSLDKGWKSEAKAAFFTQATLDLEAMTEMEAQYAEIGELLQQAATEYENSDSELMSAANGLRL